MAEADIHPERVCSKCGISKPQSAFGYTRTVRGVRLPRTQCRPCYNDRRRAHYAIPAVNSEKQIKRKAHEAKPEVRAARQRARRSPEYRAKEKIARDRYRSDAEAVSRITAQKTRRFATIEGRSASLLGASSLRARKRDLAFNLDRQWIIDRLQTGRCELTGLEFDFGKAKDDWNYNPFAPSIDQIKAGAGYTKENCRIVIVAINNALSQYGDDLFETVAKAFLEKRGLKVAR